MNYQLFQKRKQAHGDRYETTTRPIIQAIAAGIGGWVCDIVTIHNNWTKIEHLCYDLFELYRQLAVSNNHTAELSLDSRGGCVGAEQNHPH
ncbi:MAG: hypothetical protein IT324_31835 [Anaerolineae bacterium]|nr:hypothetical protein [Anaerolineae bacterium]